MTYARFRRRLCKSFLSLHDPETVHENIEGHDVHRCKWCGKHFAVEIRKRHCYVLEDL